MTETDLELGDGRTVHVYDTGAGGAGDHLAVFWQHGTPNVGAPPEPLFPAAARHGIRWVSHDRPGYGGSTPHPGRNVASAAADVAGIADALGIGRLAVMGYSGGGTYALACAALLPERVVGVACLGCMAPLGAERLDWFAGMVASGVARLRAAASGREAVTAHLAAAEFDPEEFTAADHAALEGPWGWLGTVAGRALVGGVPEGNVDDELALVAPWGFDPEQVSAPVLLVHGERDRVAPSAHGRWLARRLRKGELWLRPDDGHVSVLEAAPAALAWLRRHADQG